MFLDLSPPCCIWIYALSKEGQVLACLAIVHEIRTADFYLCPLPLVTDGFVQLFTKWESTNLLRFITGSLAGAGLALFLGFLFLKVSGAVDESLAHS